MDFTFVLLGLSIMWLFMFKTEWLFKNGIVFFGILTYSILLYGLSFVLLKGDYGNPKMINALKMPLMSFVVFRGLYYAFRKKYKKEPENTFWVFQKKPIQDVLFFNSVLAFWSRLTILSP